MRTKKKTSNAIWFPEALALPVTLNVLDKEEVIIVRSCIPGNEARDICFLLSYVICSYTCKKHPKEGKTLHYLHILNSCKDKILSNFRVHLQIHAEKYDTQLISQ